MSAETETPPGTPGGPQGGHRYVRKQTKDHDVRFVRLWFTDIVGTLKSIVITPHGLDDALDGGVSFDGSCLQALARDDEADLLALPEPSTFAVLPWRAQEDRVARMFCSIHAPDGGEHEADCRWILRRQIERAGALGFTFYVGAELEYFMLQSGALPPQPIDEAGYFDQAIDDPAADVRREVILTLEEMGVGVHSGHHEAAPGQQEIGLQYADALTLADAIQTSRYVIRQTARRHNRYATFMPRPIAGVNGSGMHFTLSLDQGGQNAFFDPGAEGSLSELGRSFVAGLLKHASDTTLVLNQWVNSYRRLVAGTEAPAYITWARTNHGDLVRVPACKPGHSENMRVEMRGPDAACNPYLALAVLLGAGLDGIEQGLTPPPEQRQSAFSLSESERKAAGIETLPSDLGRAIGAAEESEFLRSVLGSTPHQQLLANKRLEWEAWRQHISDWELRRYLPVL